MTIAILDLDLGNTGSILNILSKLQATAVVTRQPDEVISADKIILAGVGAFDMAMTALKERELEAPLREAVQQHGKYLLGICLGMQMLANTSAEGQLPGLGLIPGQVERFKPVYDGDKIRVPHMGWNRLHIRNPGALTAGITESSRFYFMHSYYYQCDDASDVVANCRYGLDFAAMIQRNNVMGTQFHPEKSHRFGLAMFEHFVQL